MSRLSSAQRAYLRKEAHDLRAVLQLGKQGLTPNLVTSVKEVFNTNELIKVKFLDFQDEKHELAEQLAEQSGSDLVAVIGNIAILYRVHPDPERRSIVLPA